MKQRRKRSLSFCLAVALGVSMVSSTGFSALAAEPVAAEGDSQAQPESSTIYEPWRHGYRLVDVLNWSPETDAYGEELRAQVPLQERNEAFAATQANPNLASNAMVYNPAAGSYRSTDVSNAPWNGNMYYDEFAYQTYKFWQYADIIGAGGCPTSGIERWNAQWSEEREYGVLGIPTPGHINAAHKNGVKVIAEYFFPRDPQYVEEWLYKDEDGNFPYAQKMIDIMNYYGFDGYFINNEADFNAEYAPLFKEMLKWMRNQGAYIQVYDGITDEGRGTNYQNRFNSVNSPWVLDETYGRVSDSMWLNYLWNENYINSSVDHAESLGLDPFETLFLGVECGTGFQGTGIFGNSVRDLDMILDDTNNPVMSIALWSSSSIGEGYNTAQNNRYKSEYQWQYEERERMWYTSPYEDATKFDATEDESFDRSDVGVADSKWKGLSRYISERSVINGTSFSTSFNTGHGMQYFQNGEVARDMEWTNISIQDIMPTWQWWIDGNGGLDLDWDYGPNYERIVNGSVLPFEYQQIGAYNGGSSLVAYGGLEGEDFIHLYKTDMDIVEDSKISLTYNKPSATDDSTMQIGLTFKSAPDNVVYLPIENAGETTDGWKTVEISLGEYAGEELAAIGVQLASEAAIPDYQVNFGQIKVSDGNSYTPDTPEGFQIDRVFDESGEIQLSWTLDDYSEVKQYNVYAGYADGSERYVGGGYAENFYIQNLEDRENVTTLKLRAVGADGSESEAAEVAFTDGDTITNIQAASENNKLNVTWDEAEGDYDSVTVTLDYFYSHKEPVSVTVDKGVKNAQLDIPLEDGSKYVLTLSTAAGSTNYFGRLADHYSEPYDGEMRFNADGTMNLTTPAASDWGKLILKFDGGVAQSFDRFGDTMLKNIAVPDDASKAVVIVEDRQGNQSLPTLFVNGEKADLNQEITADLIPDETLRQAVKEQAGATLNDMLTFDGELDVSGLAVTDLTGLDLMASLTALDVSGTQVSDLTPLVGMTYLETLNASNTQVTTISEGMLPGSLANIDLSQNSKLTVVEDGALSSLKNVENLNLADNAALSMLYLSGMEASSVDVSGCQVLTELHAPETVIGNLKVSGLANLESIVLTDAEVGPLDLSGCTSLIAVYATGAHLEEINITGCTALQVMQMDQSSLEKILCDDVSALTSLVSVDLSESKLDLSEGTPERAFVDAVAEITAGKADVSLPYPTESNLAVRAQIVTDQTTVAQWEASRLVDGSRISTAYFRASSNTVTIDLGSEQTISSWVLVNSSNRTGLEDFEIKASNDKETYTTIASVTGNAEVIATGDIENPQPYRYFQLVGTKVHTSGGSVCELELNGRKMTTYPAGVQFDSQRPEAYVDDLEKVTVTTSQMDSIRTKDYFEASYRNAETVRGTLFSSLEGAEWIAADYDVASQIAIPEDVYVEIRDENGTLINEQDAPEEGTGINLALNAITLSGSGQSLAQGQGYAQMMDGDPLTRWNTTGYTGWVVIRLDEAAVVDKWATTHAQAAGDPASYNTRDFELQVLNTELLGMSEEEFLNASSSIRNSVYRDDSYWVAIDHVRDNTAERVEREIESNYEARLYRFKINESITGTFVPAINVQELELYADEMPRDYEGVLDLVQTGLYTVEFKKSNNVLASMEVRVKAVTSVLEDVIEKAEEMKADGALDNTMQAVVDEFNAALEEAKTLVAKEDATQEELNASAVRLLAAMAKVDWKQGDKTILEVAVDVALSINEDLDLYVEAGKQEFIDALANAQEILASGNAWQDDIDAATDALIEAMSNLRMAPNKDILNDMIDQASGLDLSVYTADSAAALNAALANAKAVAADENATQAQIDTAADTLKAAMSGLVFVDADNGTTGAVTTPVGEGTAPTKTGDAGAAGLAALALMSAGALIVLKKRNRG